MVGREHTKAEGKESARRKILRRENMEAWKAKLEMCIEKDRKERVDKLYVRSYICVKA